MAAGRSPKKSTRHLEEELRGLKDLLSVAQVVVSSLDLDEVLGNILMSAMAMTEMPAGSIALYEQRGARLTLHAHQGLSDKLVTQASWKVKPGGLSARILDGGDLFIVEDTRTADFFNNPLAIAEGIRSLIAVPLKIQNKIVGVIYLDDFVPRQFSEMNLRMLSVLASFACMSIDNARLHKRTRELAATDGLTGLYNHRMFKQIFFEEFRRSERYKKPLSIIMFDVDNFKVFNDRYGHPNGDKVLVTVGELLQDCLRDCDYSFRYGGEEFIAVLPETGIAEALKAAERTRGRIESESGRALQGISSSGVTVSVGVASFPRDGDQPEGLLKAVDDLLYVAKRQGKNKVYHLPD